MQQQFQDRTGHQAPAAVEGPGADSMRTSFLDCMEELKAVRLAARRIEPGTSANEAAWLRLLDREDELTVKAAVMPVSDCESILDKLQLLEERLVRLYGGIDPASEEILMLGAIRANVVAMHTSRVR